MRALVLGMLLVAAGCASRGAGVTATRHNLVTDEQLARAGNVSLYDALRTLRPSFLRSRWPATVTTAEVPIAVYLGGMQMMEGLAHLREIMAPNVQEVSFLEPHEANARYGGNNAGGALIVIMKP